MVIPKTTASKDVGRPVPTKIPIFSPRISGDGREVLDALVHDFVGGITRDALLVSTVFHVVPQPLKPPPGPIPPKACSKNQSEPS